MPDSPTLTEEQQTTITGLLKQLSGGQTVKSTAKQLDGYYTVVLQGLEGEADTTVKDTYRYKPKQESTGDLLSLKFAKDDQGYVYIPKSYPTDQAIADQARSSFYLLDTQPVGEVFDLTKEKKTQLIGQMPQDYYPEVSPCDPADLCQASAQPEETSKEESPKEETPKEEKEEPKEAKKAGGQYTWLMMIGGVVLLFLIVFLVYYFVIRRRQQ